MSSESPNASLDPVRGKDEDVAGQDVDRCRSDAWQFMAGNAMPQRQRALQAGNRRVTATTRPSTLPTPSQLSALCTGETKARLRAAPRVFRRAR